MRLFTNVGNDKYGEYFVFNLKEAKENYLAEKNASDDYCFSNFNEYLNDFIELDSNLQGHYTTNNGNKICKVTVKIDNKCSRNLISYDEKMI